MVIVLTGEMTWAREQWTVVLNGPGYATHPAVTKKIDLVIAAGPDSLSGKGKKARDGGIPIVSEQWLREKLGV